MPSITALLCLVVVVAADPPRSSYPLSVHKMVAARLGTAGVASGVAWSSWSAWSPCSRTCGGGVTMQTRDCLPSQRRRRRQDDHRSSCVGVYKRFHTCSEQACPPGSKDFRTEQCEAFNWKPFMGKHYVWEPFLEAPTPCELNCRAVGFRFYATLNKTVVDGTPCRGQTSPSDRWVCVQGACKHVGCDGVVGSGRRVDSCGVCGGDNSTCRVVTGLFTRPTLSPGYNLLATLPTGACNVSVSEIRPSRNYLALRRADGSFILNGNWAINFSGDYDAFTYSREDPETISSAGPLKQPVDIMLIYLAPNPGIKYEYSLPTGASSPELSVAASHSVPVASVPPAPPKDVLSKEAHSSINAVDPRYDFDSALIGDEAAKPGRSRGKKNKKNHWKVTGFSQCTRTCGGGVQSPVVQCVREKDQAVVAEKRCAAQERPPLQMIRCNVKPCPAQWATGEWGECSATCGGGEQRRDVWCQQQVSASVTMKVADGACLAPAPALARSCQRPPCPLAGGWHAGPWSECSSSCGSGVRSRVVTCPEGMCPPDARPAWEEACEGAACAEGAWLHTAWSERCSEACGTGVQARRVACGGGVCDKRLRPDDTRQCSSDKHCTGQWFVGPWGQCSASCGEGQQTREALCVTFSRGQFRVLPPSTCPVAQKPDTTRPCHVRKCSPEWFFSDWSQCPRECGSTQHRVVKCLDAAQQPSSDCPNNLRPPDSRSCPCKNGPVGLFQVSDDASLPAQETHKDEKESKLHNSSEEQALGNKTEDSLKDKDSECSDQLSNCHMVVQARLCRYKYYHHSCCLSCKKVLPNLP